MFRWDNADALRASLRSRARGIPATLITRALRHGYTQPVRLCPAPQEEFSGIGPVDASTPLQKLATRTAPAANARQAITKTRMVTTLICGVSRMRQSGYRSRPSANF